MHQTIGGALNEQTGQSVSFTVGQDLQIKVAGALVTQAGNAIHIKAGSKAVIQGGMSLSVKGGAGFITLDPSGVTIMGPLVRINEGGGGGSAQAANPTVPGKPGEADNAIPGAKLRAANGAVTPVPAVIDFDKARAQLATFKQANTFNSPLVEDCPECKLAAQKAADAAAVNGLSDIPTDCLDLVCIDADGSPALNLPYQVTLADGSKRTGTLDANGKAKLTGLTPGAATVEYQTDANDAAIAATRTDIAKALNDIITAEKAESATIQAEYEHHSPIGQWWEDEKAKGRGLGSAIGGFFSMLKEMGDLTPMQQLINAHKVAWQSWRYSDERPYLQRFADNLTESQFKDVADVLGFDPRSISRDKLAAAWATANFIWDDPETQKLLLQFARDFIASQHKLEILEGASQAAGEIAIDILITAITVGMGATAAAGRKIKLLEKFKKLGPLFEKLADAIKKRRKKRKKTGQTGGEIPEQLERPVVVEPKPAKKAKDKARELEKLDDGHSLDRHGPEISDTDLQNRVLTGAAPDGKFSPTDSSTRFRSYDDWVETRQAAIDSIQTKNNIDFGDNMDNPPAPGAKKGYNITLDHERAIDEGFNGVGSTTQIINPKKPSQKGEIYSETQSISGVTKSFTRINWDEKKQRWVTTQHYPVGRGWDEKTQTYK